MFVELTPIIPKIIHCVFLFIQSHVGSSCLFSWWTIGQRERAVLLLIGLQNARVAQLRSGNLTGDRIRAALAEANLQCAEVYLTSSSSIW